MFLKNIGKECVLRSFNRRILDSYFQCEISFRNLPITVRLTLLLRVGDCLKSTLHL